MKTPVLLIIVILLSACTVSRKSYDEGWQAAEQIKRVVHPELQAILDAAGVTGSILIYDNWKDEYYSNDFDKAGKSQLPASTFKIPHSIIALESGVVEDDSTLFPWDGNARRLTAWEQDLNFKEAQLPISERTQSIARGMFIIESSEKFTLSGKTGLSNTNGNRNGWYVGYIETGDNNGSHGLDIELVEILPVGLHFFATNIDPVGEYDMQMFVKARIDVTGLALKGINAI